MINIDEHDAMMLRAYLSRLGKVGGTRRASRMSPQERSAAARKAALARWAGHIKTGKPRKPKRHAVRP